MVVRSSELLTELDLDLKSDRYRLNERTKLSFHTEPTLSILMNIKSTFVDTRQLLNVARQFFHDNPRQLKRVQEFEHLYSSSSSSSSPLTWFNETTFLYRFLLKAFHTGNVEMIFLLRFFLQDLDKQLHQCPPATDRVYRALLMSNEQLDQLNRSMKEKKPLRFLSFLVAQRNVEELFTSLEHSTHAIATSSLRRVLVQIEPNEIGKSYEQCVIFPPQTEFIVQTVRLDRDVWRVTIAMLVSDQLMPQRARTALELAHHLRTVGQLDQAERLFHRLLIEDPSSSAKYYNGLGQVAQDQGLYETSLQFYFKALDLLSRKNRSHCLNHIGCVYDSLERYPLALEFYSQSLDLMRTPLDRAMCWNNLGITCANNKQWEHAQQCLEYSLAIRQKYLADDDVQLGISYANLAVLHASLKQLDRAMDFYQRALHSFGASGAPSNFHRAIVYQNMAKSLIEKNDVARALDFYRDAKILVQDYRPVTHPIRRHIEEEIDRINGEKSFIG